MNVGEAQTFVCFARFRQDIVRPRFAQIFWFDGGRHAPVFRLFFRELRNQFLLWDFKRFRARFAF